MYLSHGKINKMLFLNNIPNIQHHIKHAGPEEQAVEVVECPGDDAGGYDGDDDDRDRIGELSDLEFVPVIKRVEVVKDEDDK